MFDCVLSCFMSDESFAKPRVPGACTAYHVLPVTREHAACHVATQQQVWMPDKLRTAPCLHAMCRRACVSVWNYFSPFQYWMHNFESQERTAHLFLIWESNGNPGWHNLYMERKLREGKTRNFFSIDGMFDRHFLLRFEAHPTSYTMCAV